MPAVKTREGSGKWHMTRDRTDRQEKISQVHAKLAFRVKAISWPHDCVFGGLQIDFAQLIGLISRVVGREAGQQCVPEA